MTKRKKHPKLRVARNMPPLYHTLPGEKYSHRKSEVLKWLSERPALIEHVFTDVSNSKDIFYNPETGKWQGVDYEEDEE
ncbi:MULTISPECIES: hypothetical protein [Clostridia]|uniref:hypothetical protein n=1 Tax=Clostridia TaxID=186801 RepID=UPI000EA33D47|nr:MULTISPECIES: hypothetical protein [Clostridia]NBJ71030.1 hypothetical protein [Roseburia sp. 1XD42-34]RKI75465.1 hypothetical protein D7V87_16440 [Clostridium sp. 1xD42-85]